MPKGVPAAGFRVRGPNKPKTVNGVAVVKVTPAVKGKRGRPRKVVPADVVVPVKVPGKRGRPRKVVEVVVAPVAVAPVAVKLVVKPVEAPVVALKAVKAPEPKKVVEASVAAPEKPVAPVSVDGLIKFTSYTELGARRSIIMLRDKYGCTDFTPVVETGSIFVFFYRDPKIKA